MIKKIGFLLILAMLASGCGIQEQITSDNQNVDFFIAVHLDPVLENYEQGTTNRPMRYWDSVVGLVEAADYYDQKLTLMMNPQWGLYILEDDDRLELVRSWEKNGHEITVHYHGPEMGENWSGYTNQERFFDDERFQGTTEDLMAIMTEIPASGEISTCTINDFDAPYEFPEDVPYSTDGGKYGFDDLISTPEKITLNSQDVLQVLHAKYGEGDTSSVSLDDIKIAVDTVESNEVIGIVFHDRAFENNPYAYLLLFEYLKSVNLQTQTVSQILNNY